MSPLRVAVLSVHTSPLEQPGTGDAGGLNVYVVEVAKRLAARGVEVEVFTRAVSRDAPPVTELSSPLAEFMLPPVTELPAPLAEFCSPPVTELASPLAELESPPVTVALFPLA